MIIAVISPNLCLTTDSIKPRLNIPKNPAAARKGALEYIVHYKQVVESKMECDIELLEDSLSSTNEHVTKESPEDLLQRLGLL